jgi:signal transduction histidine kinase
MSIGKWLRERLPSGADGSWIPLPDDLEARVPGNRERFALLTFDPDDPIGSRLTVLGDEQVALSALGRGVMRRVLESGTVQVIDDLEADAELRQAAAEQGQRAAVGFPIEVRGRVVGVASLFLDRPGVSDETLTRLRTVAATAAPVQIAPPEPPRAPPAPAASMAASSGMSLVPGQGMFDLVSAVVGEAVGRLDAEFDRAEEMTEANRLKSEFVSVLSHELRSPLTYVYGFSELLSSREVGTDQVKHVAQNIHREASLMLRLVEDLLDISRMEMGRYHIEPQPVRLLKEVNQLVPQVQSQTEKHRLVVQGEVDLVVEADPVRLRQVLQNLLNNAVRYSPNGGDVTVTLSYDDQDLRDDGSPRLARIEVRDQGVGIPEKELGRVFEKFHRVDGELKQKVRGSGLGLAISAAIVDGHGGRIWVESEVGMGSAFKFTLPLLQADELDDPIYDDEMDESSVESPA